MFFNRRKNSPKVHVGVKNFQHQRHLLISIATQQVNVPKLSEVSQGDEAQMIAGPIVISSKIQKMTENRTQVHHNYGMGGRWCHSRWSKAFSEITDIISSLLNVAVLFESCPDVPE